VSRFVSSVAVMALKMAIAVGGAFCASGCASTPPPAERHIVPPSLVHVALEDFDIVSFLDVDLHTAIQTREAVESEFESAYGKKGHPRWFFHAFDGKNLDFVVARFEPRDATRPRYVAQRRLRVKRSREAERALGVAEVVREYEIGTRGVKAGMSRREVTGVVGRPQSWIPRADPGSFDLLYPSFCVRFTNGKVAHVRRRDECSY
jgi:hypothetical protein